MSYLVDTNVISEIRKGRRGNASVRRWFSAVDDGDLFLSVLTIGDIRRGVDGIARRDPAAGASLNQWLRALVEGYESRIVAVDREIANEWGRLNVPDPLPVVDGLLAATARVRGLTLVTHNVKHVARTGITFLDPFTM